MQCFRCLFETTRVRDWKRHIKSNAHLAAVEHVCVCKNVYSTKANLRRHEAACPVILMETIEKHNEQLSVELRNRDLRVAEELRDRDILQQEVLARRDAELAQGIADRDRMHAAEMAAIRLEFASKPAVNNTFNLNFFLSDTCKTAKSMQQFVNDIALDMETDQTIDDYFVQSLSRVSIEDRPIHCVDTKRGKMVIKNVDVWERDSEKVDPLVMQSLNTLRVRYTKQLGVWTDDHPTHQTDDKLQDTWLRLLVFIHADVHAKFISRVAKATAVQKEKV